MKAFNITLLISLIYSLAIKDQSCVPKEKDCSFYSDCVENRIPCGSKGYSLNYGGKYCEKFKEHHQWFSKEGQEWIWKVMTCLQNELVPIVENENTLTCSQLKTFAYESHASCYTDKEHSICKLPISDWKKLSWIIRAELDDIETYKTAVNILSQCEKQHRELISELTSELGN